jgi:hypothetical protein
VPFAVGLRCSAAVGGSGITMLGSRNVTCRPVRRGGAGMTDLKRRAKRKAMTAMASIKLVALNT